MDRYTDKILDLRERVNGNDANSITDADVLGIMLAGIPGATRAGSLYFDTTVQRVNERIEQDNYV